MHGLKVSSLLKLHPRERDTDRTLTLLIYGLILSTVANTAAKPAEKITNFKDLRHS